MAQYKVPQDVEADDKLLGPFSFRQFVYLLLTGGFIAMAVGLFQLFPLLAIVPLPFVLFFGALSLPLKREQPMETYLAAMVSYRLKPTVRLWTPGQRETTITIAAPKITEEEKKQNIRDITEEEAAHRLSFLADVVDTGGDSIKNFGAPRMNEQIMQEAVTTQDIFENNNFGNLESTITKDETVRHEDMIKAMKQELAKTEEVEIKGSVNKWGDGEEKKEEGAESQNEQEAKEQEKKEDEEKNKAQKGPDFSSAVVVKPDFMVEEEAVEKKHKKNSEKAETASANPSIMELANNSDYSVATIAKEANRIKEREEGEVLISLH